MARIEEFGDDILRELQNYDLKTHLVDMELKDGKVSRKEGDEAILKLMEERKTHVYWLLIVAAHAGKSIPGLHSG